MMIGKVVETRSFIGSTSKCWEVVDKAIANKQYLIFNICINRNDKSGHNPTDTEWKLIVDNTCKELLDRGGNRLNSRITIINEPLKYISISRYAQLVNLAYPIVHRYGFLMGAGNEQYTMAMSKGNMYSYILQNCKFDILDIHLQGDCEEDDKCRDIANIFKSWATHYNKPLDCTECFYSDIASSKGWNILKFQIEHAERIGCSNVCNVFNNLDRSAFPWNTSSWNKLCFNINGNNRSGYWGQYLDLVKAKAPVPNIPIIKRSKDGMIIPTQTISSYDKYLAQLENELLWKLGYLQEEDITWSVTQKTVDALKLFQKSIENKYPKIMVDGKCGRQMFRYLAQEIPDSTERTNYRFAIELYGSPTKY